MLSREEPEPHRDAENQYQADVQEKTEKAGGSDIDEAPHRACDYGKHNSGCQRDQPRGEVRTKNIYRWYLFVRRATAF